MRSGLLVLALFAVGWASAGLLGSGYAAVWALLPLALSLALLAWGWRATGIAGSRGPHVGRLVGRWSAIEGAAIFVAAQLLSNFHHKEAMFPAIAIIVGLHFLPLARGIPARIYYATGAGLIAAGLIGLLLPAGERPLAVGMSAALILWATGIVVVMQARRTPAAA